MKQHEVTMKQPLLDAKGHINEPGWARNLIWQYDRKHIKAPGHRIKEWDYYLVSNDHFGAAFTISDLGYIGMVSVSVLDFDNGEHHTETILIPLPLGRFHLGSHSDQGKAEFQNKRVHLKYSMVFDRRRIQCHFKNFKDGKDLDAEIWLLQKPTESMCIATPWKEKPKAFYYNQKINCMPASGCLRLGETQWRFRPEDSMGVLDWGRGVWTYDNTWYWGTGSGWVDGVPFGLNIGYGFSDRSAASENVIYCDGKIHKLEEITICIPMDFDGNQLYMEPWEILSSDERLEGEFIPIFDRAAKIDMKLVMTDQHQVFGRFSGKAVLDDGRELEIKDFLLGVEVVHNKY
ncbi:MAG: DUF2804 domain-containing protein [Clostridia bacterium]|nr:DUF2804 domain-containing protein [Lachnospiraceae bacterium]NCB99374.1 DUF2804 domain-containing protein [Clostridia bacterium]NCD01523.1 DUF2804 domain-containing protein [Clostridia bacterium]